VAKKPKELPIRKLHCRTNAYSKIIKINVPTYFYWDEDGEFDGLSLDIVSDKISRYQINLIEDVLSAASGLIDGASIKSHKITKPQNKEKTNIPKFILEAFKDDDAV